MSISDPASILAALSSENYAEAMERLTPQIKQQLIDNILRAESKIDYVAILNVLSFVSGFNGRYLTSFLHFHVYFIYILTYILQWKVSQNFFNHPWQTSPPSRSFKAHMFDVIKVVESLGNSDVLKLSTPIHGIHNFNRGFDPMSNAAVGVRMGVLGFDEKGRSIKDSIADDIHLSPPPGQWGTRGMGSGNSYMENGQQTMTLAQFYKKEAMEAIEKIMRVMKADENWTRMLRNWSFLIMVIQFIFYTGYQGRIFLVGGVIPFQVPHVPFEYHVNLFSGLAVIIFRNFSPTTDIYSRFINLRRAISYSEPVIESDLKAIKKYARNISDAPVGYFEWVWRWLWQVLRYFISYRFLARTAIKWSFDFGFSSHIFDYVPWIGELVEENFGKAIFDLLYW